MPRFFFNLTNGTVHTDTEGVDFPDLTTAKRQAVHTVGELLREAPAHFLDNGGLQLTLTDEKGVTLFIIDVSARSSPVPWTGG